MLQQLLNTYTRLGYTIYTRPFELNIVGIRNPNATPNHFDDTIAVFYQREDGQWIINRFKATTDPGTYWLKQLMNPAGTAILKPGQYIHSHRIGVHRNKYQALVQQQPVTVIRDGNKDGVLNFDNPTTQTGLFGINIHRALMKGKTKYVNDHSAGCQVFEDVNDFHLFMSLAQRHKELYGNQFTYTLLPEKELQSVKLAA
jgi:hypothetical protein